MTTPTESKHQYVLTACCPGIVGTTAKISGFLARRHCYITDMQQFDDILSMRILINLNTDSGQFEQLKS